jgi:hypothetical protein
MAHPYHHALKSVKKFGGSPEDYLAIHNWFDATKAHYGDFRHRALRHHTLGIFECEEKFGVTLVTSDGKTVPVRLVAEQHVNDDCGFIPTVCDWLGNLARQEWMNNPEKIHRVINLEIERKEATNV